MFLQTLNLLNVCILYVSHQHFYNMCNIDFQKGMLVELLLGPMAAK